MIVYVLLSDNPHTSVYLSLSKSAHYSRNTRNDSNAIPSPWADEHIFSAWIPQTVHCHHSFTMPFLEILAHSLKSRRS
jgi:hypothetical protein